MRDLVVRSLLAGVSLLAGSAALAQDNVPAGSVSSAGAPVADSTADADVLPSAGEIIVTAQNRAQRLKDVPIAISVISGDTLRAAGVTDFRSAERVSPALQITSDTTATRVTVRGVGSLSNNESQDQSIAVDIDGEYINRPTILNAAIFDLDRIEVLRGPQGTLYGRNSTGGAVNFITRKPGDHFSANGSVSYGNYNQVIAEGGVDLPFGEIGGLRLAGIYSDHDGFNLHPNTPVTTAAFTPSSAHRSGDDHTAGGRASLRLKPVEGLTIDVAGEHVEQNIIPANQAFVNLNAAGNSPGANCAGNGYVEVGLSTPGTQCIPQNTQFLKGVDRSTYDSPLTGLGFFHLNTSAVRGRVAYNLGPATVTYTGGYRWSDTTGINTLGPAYATRNFGGSVKTNSHELRFNGDLNGIVWQAGAFYFKEKQVTNEGIYSPFIGPNGSYVAYFRRPTNTESISGFGQVEVPLIDRVTAVGGIRYTHDKRSAVWSDYGFIYNSGFVEQSGPSSNVRNLSYSGSKITWLGGINYKPDQNTLIYGKVSTGYKAGGFDSVATFKPETNTAYEGGLKINFGRNKGNSFNLAGFYYDYTNLQNDVILNSAIGSQTFNAGKATIYGAEAETTIKLSRLDTFTASFNYLHARYDQFTASYAVLDLENPSQTSLVDAAGNAVTVDLRGKRLPQTPKFTITLGYDHRFDLGSAGQLTFSVYSRFKSDLFFDIYNYRDSRQTAYTQTDLSLEYKPANGRFGVQGYVRNVENIRPLAYASYVAAGSDDVFNWQFGPPRTYGVRVSFNF